MADVLTSSQRRYCMSQIKDKNTKPEQIVRKWLWANGFRYRLHGKKLPGKPDIVFPGCRKVIFVHGCFWHKHRCKYFKWPATNESFWREKIESNVKRDKRNRTALKKDGWQPFVIWECELKPQKIDSTFQKLREFMNSND